jgi:hypothetical protein
MHENGARDRPNADSTISLLTLGTASFLHGANRTTLERMGLAASRRLESWMQSLEMTELPKSDRLGDCPETPRSVEEKALRQESLFLSDRKWGNSKGGNCNDESKDENVRTHPVSLHCSKWGRILRRGVSRRGKRRRGNRMSMRPSGVSTHGSAICVRQRH